MDVKKKKILKEFSIARSFDAFQDTLRDTLWIKKKKNSSFKRDSKIKYSKYERTDSPRGFGLKIKNLENN